MTGVRAAIPVGIAVAAVLGAGILSSRAQTVPDNLATTSFDRELVSSGQRIAMGGASEGGQAAACFACHGLQGQGDGTGAFPRLTGQGAWYLYKQLKDYASGARPNDIMSPIAKMLTDAEMEAVAAYYSVQEAPYAPQPEASPKLMQLGGALAAVGSQEIGVQGCNNCHGPAGQGIPPVYPYLAGQYAEYVELQLQLWREGVRKNDPLGIMKNIAERLSPEQSRAVAVYFESVRPPTAFAPVPEQAPAQAEAAP